MPERLFALSHLLGDPIERIAHSTLAVPRFKALDDWQLAATGRFVRGLRHLPYPTVEIRVETSLSQPIDEGERFLGLKLNGEEFEIQLLERDTAGEKSHEEALLHVHIDGRYNRRDDQLASVVADVNWFAAQWDKTVRSEDSVFRIFDDSDADDGTLWITPDPRRWEGPDSE